MTTHDECTLRCEAQPPCLTCGQRKKPIGRDMLDSAGYCTDECDGYRRAPYPGHLWPGELKRIREDEAAAQPPDDTQRLLSIAREDRAAAELREAVRPRKRGAT